MKAKQVMKAKKGFTLIELMVVVLIIGILAAAAIPLMRGRIDSAKWAEGKAAAGTIASAIRACAAEKGVGAIGLTNLVVDFGFANNDLDGTYFSQACYVVSGVNVNAGGQVAFTITVTAASSTRAGFPTTPKVMTLSQAISGATVWTVTVP
jgi:type IV pilus assembly protein PilA